MRDCAAVDPAGQADEAGAGLGVILGFACLTEVAVGRCCGWAHDAAAAPVAAPVDAAAPARASVWFTFPSSTSGVKGFTT